jgi:hypothetical protein
MLFHGLLIRSDLNRKLLLLSGVLFVLFFVSLLKVWIFKRIIREARKRFGILEKHKDYIIRANAYHKKQETLKILRQKAAFKNPDEFNFKMINSKTVDGRHRPK